MTDYNAEVNEVVIIAGISVLSLISGMLGLGVAFSAIPFLGLFMEDLVHQVQPLSLLLNGTTALLSALGFARSGFIDWRRAITLALITTSSAPIGAFIVQYIDQKFVWIIYFCAVLYLAYRLFKPVKVKERIENFKIALILAIPISILSGFLGVGPGFLLMPTLILVGIEPKKAAAINAFAVCPPSFSSLIPHIWSAQWNTELTIYLVVSGSFFSFIGARITSLFIPSEKIKKIFAVLILIVTAYRIFKL